MNPKIAAALATVSFALGAGSAVALVSEDAPLPVVEPSALLLAATPECLAEVNLVGANPVCTMGETTLGDEPAKGWVCNGAFMGEREQKCLDEAAALVRSQTP